MNDDSILREIKNYMNNPLKYAILLEGNWGTGKTYFIQNKLKELNVIYLSLYGVNSISNLAIQLFYQVAPFKNNKLFKRLTPSKSNKVGSIGTVFLSYLENKYNLSINELFNLIQNVDIKDKLIIIDDFERTTLNIDEVLGFINNLVEHNKTKVMIVANEEEIKSNEAYMKYKEKLIYQTFKYQPNLDEIYDSLTKNEDKCLKNNKDFVLDVLKRKNHQNIRTIQFIIQRYKELIIELDEIIKNSVNKSIANEIKEKIFKYLVVASVLYKIGETLPKFDNDADISFVEINNSLGSAITSFKFINDFILGYSLDKDNTSKVLKNYSKEVLSNITNSNNPLYILSSWWEVEDKEIIEGNSKLISSLKKNECDYSFYPKILIYLVNTSEIGIKPNIKDEAIKLMKSNIKLSEEEVSLGNRMLDTLPEHLKEEYYKLRKELDEDVEKHNKSIKVDKYDEFIKKQAGDIGLELHRYCTKNDYYYTQKKTFIKDIGIENIITIIKKGNSLDMRFLVYLFYDIYNYSNMVSLFPDDKDLIVELKNLIQEIDKSKMSKMKIFNINVFIKCLDDIIGNYEK